MFTRTLLVLLLLLLLALAACGKDESGSEAATVAKPLLLVNADLLTTAEGELSQGPLVSGSLQPERRADLRAEVSGIVLQVLKDNGDEVKKGELLLRLDPTSIRAQLLSAQEAERAAGVALAQAESQLKRWRSMSDKGLVAVETLEGAEVKRNQALADVASAKARAAEARQQLEKTEVRAPFDGIVSGRLTSAGDTAQVGKELIKVVDPASMRFEGFISADEVGRVKSGSTVGFRVNGYPGESFAGVVLRVNPIANEATRQVQVLVSVPDTQVQLVAGLYAEGRIQVQSRAVVMLPESAVVREGDDNFVWRVQGGALKRVPVTLGEQDSRYGSYEVLSGVGTGEQILRHPQGVFKDGAKVQIGSGNNGGAVAATGK